MPRELPAFLVDLLNKARKNRAAVDWAHVKAVKEEAQGKRAEVLAAHSAAQQHSNPGQSHGDDSKAASAGDDSAATSTSSPSSSSSPAPRPSHLRPTRPARDVIEGKEEKTTAATSSASNPASSSYTPPASAPLNASLLSSSPASGLPPCPQGLSCTRQNASHRRNFSHDAPPIPRHPISVASASHSPSSSTSHTRPTGPTLDRFTSDRATAAAARIASHAPDDDGWMENDDEEAPVRRAKVKAPATRRRRRLSDDEAEAEYRPSREELRLVKAEEEAEEAQLREDERAEARTAADDEDEGEGEDDDEEVIQASKPRCAFGAACYRTNPTHLAQYRHPLKTAVSTARAR